MKVNEIIEKVKTLDLPSNGFVVFGSAPLAIYGLREVKDIDLMVTGKIYEDLKNQGWSESSKSLNNFILENGDFEAGETWNFGSYNPTFEELFGRASDYEGIKIASLNDVKNWKTAWGREKDTADLKLIEEYQRKHG